MQIPDPARVRYKHVINTDRVITPISMPSLPSIDLNTLHFTSFDNFPTKIIFP